MNKETVIRNEIGETAGLVVKYVAKGHYWAHCEHGGQRRFDSHQEAVDWIHQEHKQS